MYTSRCVDKKYYNGGKILVQTSHFTVSFHFSDVLIYQAAISDGPAHRVCNDDDDDDYFALMLQIIP